MKRLALTRAGLIGSLVLASGCSTISVPFMGGGPPSSQPMIRLDEDPDHFVEEASGIYVVIDLDVNRLSLMDGGEELWNAPVGTGTGLRLEGEDGEWDFSTPQGVFQIQYKEELPVWILPDWYFVEKGMPIPPRSSPERRAPGQLGVAAVYLGQEIAIHGTERPELLGDRVSHGCIRLENKYALRLFHNVQVGTPVVIRGGEELANLEPAETTDPGRSTPQAAPDTLSRYTTPQLLHRVGSILADEGDDERWVAYTSRLITRALKEDADALRGLLSLAGTARSDRLNREFGTFLADLYARGTFRSVVSLARIDEEARTRAAHSIVEATMSLHAGRPDDPTAPWPTRRVPAGNLGPDGQAGWRALAGAENEYRERARLAANGGG